MEQEIDTEEKARGTVTGEIRIQKTQHMTASRWTCHHVSVLSDEPFDPPSRYPLAASFFYGIVGDRIVVLPCLLN